MVQEASCVAQHAGMIMMQVSLSLTRSRDEILIPELTTHYHYLHDGFKDAQGNADTSIVFARASRVDKSSYIL